MAVKEIKLYRRVGLIPEERLPVSRYLHFTGTTESSGFLGIASKHRVEMHLTDIRFNKACHRFGLK